MKIILAASVALALLAPAVSFAGDPIPGIDVGAGKNPGWQLVATPNGPQPVGRSGMTLYNYDGDQPGKSSCTGACTKQWIPLPVADKGFETCDWTIIKRDDGTRQWAFKGKPLYFFVADKKPGDTNGKLVKGWNIGGNASR